MKRPVSVYILILFHLIIGINAVSGGGMLMLKPDGSLLGMEKEWLNHSPFSNYLIPGTILFVMNGLLPLFTAVGLFFKPKWHLKFMNLYPGKYWAWSFSLYSGVIILTWIIVQQIMTSYFWIQPLVASLGLGIIVFTMIPSVISYYDNAPDSKHKKTKETEREKEKQPLIN